MCPPRRWHNFRTLCDYNKRVGVGEWGRGYGQGGGATPGGRGYGQGAGLRPGGGARGG